MTNSHNWFFPGPFNHTTDHWSLTTSHYSNMVLPPELQPLPETPALPPPPPPPPPRVPGGGGGPRNNDRNNTGPGRDGNAGQQRGPHTNNSYHNLFKTYWNGVPAHCQTIGIKTMLQAAGSSTGVAVGMLGLQSQDCGLFHIQGVCSRRMCENRHRERNLDTAKVQQVVDLLRQGQATLN